MSVAYLIIGVVLAVNAAYQLRDDMAVLPVVSGVAALALVVAAVAGLARPGSRTRTH
jgi:hypothetical protein